VAGLRRHFCRLWGRREPARELERVEDAWVSAIETQGDGRASGARDLARKRAWAACYGGDGRTRRRQCAKGSRKNDDLGSVDEMAPVEVEATSKQAATWWPCRSPTRPRHRRWIGVGRRPLARAV
jgi:hypothetical protein